MTSDETTILPDIVLRDIFAYLPRCTAASVSRVCKKWQRIAKDAFTRDIVITTHDLADMFRRKKNLRDVFPRIEKLVVVKSDGMPASTRSLKRCASPFSHANVLLSLLGTRPSHIKVVEPDDLDAANVGPSVENIIFAATATNDKLEAASNRRRTWKLAKKQRSAYETMYDRLRSASPSHGSELPDAGAFIRDLFAHTCRGMPVDASDFEFAPVNTVDISDCSSVDDQTVWRLCNSGVCGHRLIFSGCPRVTNKSLAYALRCPQLAVVDASRTNLATESGNMGLLTPSRVKVLSLSRCIAGEGCAKQLMQCTELHTLDTSKLKTTGIAASWIAFSIHKMSQLVHLNISGWENVPLVATIVHSLPALRTLIIRDCPQFDPIALRALLHRQHPFHIIDAANSGNLRVIEIFGELIPCLRDGLQPGLIFNTSRDASANTIAGISTADVVVLTTDPRDASSFSALPPPPLSADKPPSRITLVFDSNNVLKQFGYESAFSELQNDNDTNLWISSVGAREPASKRRRIGTGF